jgi:mRNA interferase RelE/StbE
VKVHYSKRFLKKLARTPSQIRTKIEKFAFEELPNAASMAETGKIERMQGYGGYYKARFGSHRVGIKVENGTLILQVVMDRKEIYKFFP